jgi:hypothetical protein
VEGLVDQLVLELAALGDVAGVPHQPAHPGTVQEVGDRELGRAAVAVAVAQGQLQLQDPVGALGHLGQPLAQPGGGVGIQDAAQRLAEQLLVAVAEHPGHGLTHVLDAGVGVDQDHDLAAVLDQGLEALLGGPQLGRALDHPRFQVAGQRGVLQQAQDLAPDQGEDDERPGPGGELVEDALLDLGHGGHDQGRSHGDIGQQQPHLVAAGGALGPVLALGVGGLPGQTGGGPAGGEQDEDVADEPAASISAPDEYEPTAVRYTKPLSATAQATSPPPSRDRGMSAAPGCRRALVAMNSTIVPTTTSPIG